MSILNNIKNFFYQPDIEDEEPDEETPSSVRPSVNMTSSEKNEEPASAGNPPEFLPYCNSARIVV